jgi:CHAT domain-containing protein/tetratricopeptide (TPR) repeat protein
MKVAITNVDTGLTREVVTDNVGQYSVSLPVGNYEVSFFSRNSPHTESGIPLHVNDRLQVNGRLNVKLSEAQTITFSTKSEHFGSGIPLLVPDHNPRLIVEFAEWLLVTRDRLDQPSDTAPNVPLREKSFCVQGGGLNAANWLLEAPSWTDYTQIATTSLETIHEINSLLDRGREFEAQDVARALLARVESVSGRDALEVAEVLDLLYGAARRSLTEDEKGEFVERAVAIREKVLGPIHPDLATSLINLGANRALAGDPAARPLLERAVAIREAALGPDHPLVAGVLRSFGGVLMALDDDERAKTVLEQAQRILEAAYGVNQLDTVPRSYVNGTWFFTPTHYAIARRYLERALLLGEKIPLSPLTLHFLIGTPIVVNEPGGGFSAGTARFNERLLALTERSFGPTDPRLKTPLEYLAMNRLNLGDYAAAKALAERSLDITEGAFGPNRLAALPEGQALAYASSLSSALDLMLHLSATRPGERAMSVAAWDAVIRDRGMVLDEMTARHRSANTSESKETAARVEALASARQHLAALYVRDLTDDPPGGLLEQAIREKERADRDLAEKSVRFPRDLSRSRIGPSDLVTALPAQSALVSFVRYRPHNLEPAYLAFVLRGGDSVPAVVPLGSAANIEGLILQWRKQLDQEALASGRGSQLGEAAYRRVAGELRQRVWDPLLPHMSNVTRVFVVPDGALHLVNLAALPTGASQYLVETGPLIHYLWTERDLVTTDGGRPLGEGLLALGGPSFDESSLTPVASAASFRGTRSTCGDFQSMRFDPLPASLNEVNEVVTLWNQARGPALARSIPLTGAEATESAFKAGAIGRRILHLATHGFFLGGRCASALDPAATSTPAAASKITRENPLLLSGLILAGANHREAAQPDREDGVLTAEEVAVLNLSGVEWAVLSGCDTGVGEVRTGEGVFGLRRAFRVAGAKTVIMSLWPVEDKSTRQWMTTLYAGRLTRKLNTADAVRDASLTVLRQRRASRQNTHPFYWAGFVAAGDWR